MDEIFIKKTIYGEYFDDKIQDVYLLNKSSAFNIWSKYIDRNSNSFFRLDDSNPIILNASVKGYWRDLYDFEDLSKLKNILLSILDWQDSDQIYFCLNKSTIIETNYSVLLNNIFSFLELYDDCPIIINCNKKNTEYIYFTSFGDIYHSFKN